MASSRLTRRKPRGQAMVEYSIVSHAILALGVAVTVPFWARILDGLNAFYDSLYTIIETAL
jgi:hypothetical protein